MVDVAGAEKKLRQATFFLGHLEYAPREMRRNYSARPEQLEQLEFYFSACLSAAKSVYYVLEETGGAMFKEIQRRWRAALPEPERSRFGWMMGLRDDDVHLASTDAEALPKYVKEDFSRSANSYYHSALLSPAPNVEEENPDGSKVSGPVLRGTVGLYIQQQGRRIEAANACREFIGQLGLLLGEVKASAK